MSISSREVEVLDEHRWKFTLEIPHDGIAGEWRKVLPDPLPSTHQIRCNWISPTKVELWYERKDADLEAAKKRLEAVLDEAAPLQESPPAPLPGNAIPNINELAKQKFEYVDLAKLTVQKLEELAAENSVKLPKKNMTQPQIIAAIIDGTTKP